MSKTSQKNTEPQNVSLTPEEAESLKQRLLESNLSLDDAHLIAGIIDFNFWLRREILTKNISIKKLKKIFGFKTEKKETDYSVQNSDQCNNDNMSNDTTIDLEASSNSSEVPQEKKPKWNKDKNHGRYGASDYWGCETVHFNVENLNPGDMCPSCAAVNTRSKLYQEKPGILVKLKGNPLVTGTCYHVERLHCTICDSTYSATVPSNILSQPKYDVTCYTAIAMARYYTGQPFYRIQQCQSAQGIPLADATQWDKMSELYEIVLPIFCELEKHASNSELMHYDDTPNRILENKKLREEGKVKRKCVFTTAVVTNYQGQQITLFYTGEKMAGENVQSLLSIRSSSSPLITMMDASPHNIPKEIDDDVAAKLVICFCLVHGRRKFFEICDFFDKECDFVLSVISKIYQHEATCKAENYNDAERLIHHQKYSAPLMKSLHAYLNNLLLHKTIEENNALGKSVKYMLRHWEALTRFLRVPGAPIDNSLSERTIKIVIRHRKNSLFFKTATGARVGDCLMSIIHTAVHADVSPYDYLNQLQIHASEVKEDPESWLPWNYQATLNTLKKAA